MRVIGLSECNTSLSLISRSWFVVRSAYVKYCRKTISNFSNLKWFYNFSHFWFFKSIFLLESPNDVPSYSVVYSKFKVSVFFSLKQEVLNGFSLSKWKKSLKFNFFPSENTLNTSSLIFFLMYKLLKFNKYLL